MRLVKSPREVALIRQATRIAGHAIMEAMRSTAPGVGENDLHAVARSMRNGVYHIPKGMPMASGVLVRDAPPILTESGAPDSVDAFYLAKAARMAASGHGP